MRQLPILTHARNTTAFGEVVSHFAREVDRKVTIVPSSNMAACMHMAIDGLGVAVLPEAMVRSELTGGRLLSVSYAWVPSPLVIAARYYEETAPAFVASIADIACSIARQFDIDKLNDK